MCLSNNNLTPNEQKARELLDQLLHTHGVEIVEQLCNKFINRLLLGFDDTAYRGSFCESGDLLELKNIKPPTRRFGINQAGDIVPKETQND